MSDWKISLKTILVGVAWLGISLWSNDWKPNPELAKDVLTVVVMGQLPTAVRKASSRADDK